MIWRTEIEVIKVKASMPVSVTDICFLSENILL